MRAWSFLLSRRWVLFAVTVALLAWGAWWLGGWQFDRLDERQQRNAIIERNESAPAAEVADVMPLDGEVAAADAWRTVTATGEYAVEDTIIVRYRSREGAPGVDVVVPLLLDGDRAVLVDRGWVPTQTREVSDVDVPPPPPGTVTVTGYVRRDGTGDSTAVTDGSTRAVSSEAIAEATGLTLHDGFVDLADEDPAPAQALVPPELPELDNGPHFFYGLQWWFFGLLALGGFGYLAWDERRKGRRPATPGPAGHRSQGPEGAPVDRQHHAAEE